MQVGGRRIIVAAKSYGDLAGLIVACLLADKGRKKIHRLHLN